MYNMLEIGLSFYSPLLLPRKRRIDLVMYVSYVHTLRYYREPTKRVHVLTYAHPRSYFRDFHSYKCMGAAIAKSEWVLQ